LVEMSICVQSYEKTREMQKKNLFSFHFRVHVTSPSLMARLLKVERKTKKLVSFFAEME